jgi:hypothetical protein
MFSKARGVVLALVFGLGSCGDDGNVPRTFSVGSAASETETCVATKDTFVWNEVPDFNIGAYSVCEVGRENGKNGGVGIKRALLHFDVGNLPSEAIITAATLRLRVGSRTIQEPLDLNLTVSRLTTDFVEGDGTMGVTWNSQPGVEATPTDTATMNAQVGEWFEMDVTAVTVAEWQSADPTNVIIQSFELHRKTRHSRCGGFHSERRSMEPERTEPS